MNTSETWALSWSQQQSTLHVEPMEEMLNLNRRALLGNTGGDYRLIFAGSRVEVERYADAIRSVVPQGVTA